MPKSYWAWPGSTLYAVTIPHDHNQYAARREWCLQNVPPVKDGWSWTPPRGADVYRSVPSQEKWCFAELGAAVMFELTWG